MWEAVAFILFAWALVFLFYDFSGKHDEGINAVCRSLINLTFMQLFLVDAYRTGRANCIWYLFDDADDFVNVCPTQAPSFLMTMVVASICSYNFCDSMNTIYLKEGWFFIFHHTCVIAGAITPLFVPQYYALYIIGWFVECSSILYNFRMLYAYDVLWTPAHITWWLYLMYRIIFTAVRIIAGYLFYLHYCSQCPLWANAIYVFVSVGISLFSLVASAEMWGVHISDNPDF